MADGPAKGMRKHRIGVNYIKEFLDRHGHSDVPRGTVVDGLDIRTWWSGVRTNLDQLPEHKRADILALGELGADLRPPQQLKQLRLDEEAQQAARRREAQERQREQQRRAAAERQAHLAEQARERALKPHRAVLQAIEAFAADRMHTLIPLDARTADGTALGQVVDRWRQNRKGVGPHLAEALQAIPYWTWTRTPPPRIPKAPRPVQIPADTTRMNRTGLRQFLPSD